MLQTSVVNPPDAAADLFHQFHAVERTEEQGISGNALAAQVLLPHPSGKSPQRYDLHPVLEDVNLHVGCAAIVAVGNGVHHGLSQCALWQLQPFVPALGMGYEGGIQLGLKIGHDILVDGVEVPVKLLAIQDMGLGAAPEDRAGYAGLESEAGDVVGQAPLRLVNIKSELANRSMGS